VACAHGGTSLDQWDHRRRDEGLGSLYGAMLARIRQAGGNLRGLLWYQGESEAMTDSAATYRRQFASWSAGGEQGGLGEVEINFTGVAGCLLPCRGIKGFSILRADLKPHPTIAVCQARRHSRKKNAVIVKTTRPLAPGNVLAYGHGLMPIGNLVDEADMAVPAFRATIVSLAVARTAK
jgi:hypothetical protein